MTQNLSAPLLSTSANPSLIDPAGPHESHKNIVRIDENGEVNIQKFHRHYFVRKGFVRHRDLLLLDPELPVPFPTAILTRDTSIILCVQPVRMLITENQCFIFNVPSLVSWLFLLVNVPKSKTLLTINAINGTVKPYSKIFSYIFVDDQYVGSTNSDS